MSTVVSDEKELGEAIKKDALEIEVEKNSLTGQTIIRVKAVGRVAWGACVAAFAIAVTSIVFTLFRESSSFGGSPSGGGDYSAGGPELPAPDMGGDVAGIPIGLLIAIIAVAIGLICVVIALLNKYRKYKIKERDGKIILTKK